MAWEDVKLEPVALKNGALSSGLNPYPGSALFGEKVPDLTDFRNCNKKGQTWAEENKEVVINVFPWITDEFGCTESDRRGKCLFERNFLAEKMLFRLCFKPGSSVKKGKKRKTIKLPVTFTAQILPWKFVNQKNNQVIYNPFPSLSTIEFLMVVRKILGGEEISYDLFHHVASLPSELRSGKYVEWKKTEDLKISRAISSGEEISYDRFNYNPVVSLFSEVSSGKHVEWGNTEYLNLVQLPIWLPITLDDEIFIGYNMVPALNIFKPTKEKIEQGAVLYSGFVDWVRANQQKLKSVCSLINDANRVSLTLLSVNKSDRAQLMVRVMDLYERADTRIENLKNPFPAELARQIVTVCSSE